MSDLNALKGRIDAEISGFQKEVEQFQTAAKNEYEARENRFNTLFISAADHVAKLARPRLELLIERFKSKMNVQPSMSAHLREVRMNLDSPLARIDLTFRLSHDADVKNLVLDQTLEVLPILMKFDKSASLTMPLDKLDDDKLAKWFDDRIVSFVQTVGDINRNQHYLKDHLVTDPIAGVQMPKYAAHSTHEVDGKKHYFISEATKNEFVKKRGGAAK